MAGLVLPLAAFQAPVAPPAPVAAVAQAPSAPSAAEAVVVVTVENMYSAADDSKDVVSQATLGQVVEVLESSGAFARVRTPDRYEGWIARAALAGYADARAPRYARSGTVVEVTSLMANLYREPDVTSARPLLQAPLASRLEVVANGPGEGWRTVRLPSGETGYVQKGDLRPVDPSAPRRQGEPREIVATARRFLGVPYLWGGMTARGIDCSGLASRVYHANGVDLPRDAGMQFEDPDAVPVPRGALRPGDLLFFGRDAKHVSHVGLYAGDGRFINSTTYETPMVRVDRLADPRWELIYQGARRPRSPTSLVGAAPADQVRAESVQAEPVRAESADAEADPEEVLFEKLRRRIKAVDARLDGILGVYVEDLSTHARLEHRADESFPTASSIKLAILYELFRQSAEKRIDLAEVTRPPAEGRVRGGGVLQELGDRASLTWRDLAVLMICWSDNEATNLLIRRIGMDAVNRRLDSVSLPHTRLRRQMMDLAAAQRGEENVSTPREMARLTALVAGGEGLPPERAADLRALATIADEGSPFRRGLPQGQNAVSKPGALEGVRCEAAWVDVPGRPYAAAIMTSYLMRDGDGEAAITEISAAVYDTFDRLARSSPLGRALRERPGAR